MKIVVVDINLGFFRYVVYDQGDELHEKVFFQLPWTKLEKHLGKYKKIYRRKNPQHP